MKHLIYKNTNFFPSGFTKSLLHTGDLFLDIETTGLSKDRSRIYLIGFAHYTGGSDFSLHQLFAERISEESAILREFMEFLAQTDIRRIITFNGLRFDLPFLNARAKSYDFNLNILTYEQLDIYKECHRRKELLQLINYKQKTIETFLGIDRADPYSGGELIRVYEHYAKAPTEDAAHMLLLHNYEDVLNMHRLLDVFAYDRLFSEEAAVIGATIEDFPQLDGKLAQELIVILQAPVELPGELSIRHPVTDVYMHIKDSVVRARIPLYDHMARLYFSDYKNYYYLPAEDMAIHKSLAMCIDSAHKQKATPDTCYVRVTVDDAFLCSDQLTEFMTHTLRSFLPKALR